MRFTLTIDLGNAAMLTPADVAGALGEVAVRLADDYDEVTRPVAPRIIFDLNGARVGTFEFIDETRDRQADGTVRGTIRLYDGSTAAYDQGAQ